MQNAASAQMVTARARRRVFVSYVKPVEQKTQPVAFVMCFVEFGKDKSTNVFFKSENRRNGLVSEVPTPLNINVKINRLVYFIHERIVFLVSVTNRNKR